jgi:hypothetical protein
MDAQYGILHTMYHIISTRRFLSLYSGLMPSLILTLNPGEFALVFVPAWIFHDHKLWESPERSRGSDDTHTTSPDPRPLTSPTPTEIIDLRNHQSPPKPLTTSTRSTPSTAQRHWRHWILHLHTIDTTDPARLTPSTPSTLHRTYWPSRPPRWHIISITTPSAMSLHPDTIIHPLPSRNLRHYHLIAGSAFEDSKHLFFSVVFSCLSTPQNSKVSRASVSKIVGVQGQLLVAVLFYLFLRGSYLKPQPVALVSTWIKIVASSRVILDGHFTVLSAVLEYQHS